MSGAETQGDRRPIITVVIPAFMRTELLRKAIVSVFRQDLDPHLYELIVVDSSPNDGNQRLVEALLQEAPCALRIYVKPPEGPGPSRNLGAARSAAPYIAFMDSDCQAHPSWLRHTTAAFADGVGLVQGKTRPDPSGRSGVFTWCPTTETENFVYECTNIAYRREAFEQAGGFHADLTPTAITPLGGEDVELAWTVKRLGWTSRFANESIVYHELVPISIWQWIVVKRLVLWPRLAGKYPELRRYFVAKYFWDMGQALLVLAIGGMVLTPTSGWAAVLCVPYLVLRGTPPSTSFPGILRPLRVLPYAARDIASLLLLIAGSIRYRAVLL